MTRLDGSNRPDWSSLRPGKPGCPSDLLLDRYAAEELGAEAAASVRAHLATCDDCSSRLAASCFEAMADVDPRVLLAGIRRGLDVPRSLKERAGAFLRRFAAVRVPLAVLAGVAAVLLVLPLTRRPAVDEPATVRQKGGLVLRVYRAKGTGSEELLSGSRFLPGDVIRFVVDLPSSGHVAVIGVEQSGELYNAWPLEEQATLARQPAGKSLTLPGALSLDGSLGRETLYLVHCPDAAEPPKCQSRGSLEPPSCPAGCALTPFVLYKDRAP